MRHLSGGHLVFAACAWECIALASKGRLPTWSAILRRLPPQYALALDIALELARVGARRHFRPRLVVL